MSWTRGQYSVWRVVFGIYLVLHFAMLLPWGTELFSSRGVLPDGTASSLLRAFPNVLAVADGPGVVLALLVAALIASVLFAAGVFDRAAAVVVWYVLACLFGRNPLIANPSLPFVGWLLLAHAFVPRAPYGSWAARGRADPRGGWQLPRAIWAAAWIVMAAGYSYSGYTKLISPSWTDGTALARVLANPLARPTFLRDLTLAMPPLVLQLATWGTLALELLYAPLALSRRIRPLLWLLMLAMHLGLMVVIDFADLSFGMVMLHLFTFDPAWVRRTAPATTDVVFYDGACGLCHRAIRFLIAEDASGTAFTFAPLQGEQFAATYSPAEREQFPDSAIVRTASGETLMRSAAVIHLLRRLGGLWRVLAATSVVLPHRALDRLYDFVARTRTRVFAKPADACPVTLVGDRPARIFRRGAEPVELPPGSRVEL